MSQEEVTRFYNDLANDKDLQQKAAGLGQKFGEAKPDEAEIVAEIVKLARASNYSFSAKEVKEYMGSHQNRALSDDELEAVAGGLASYGWEECFCYVGGGGTKKSEGITCACVVGGGGKKDKDGHQLICVVAGINY